MGPGVTIMVGRLDDWMKDRDKKYKPCIDPGVYEWAGVAVFKRAYEVFQERGLRARLLSAAYRNHLQWTELVGGEVVVSIPFGWQQRFQASGIDPTPRMDIPVDTRIVDTLYDSVPDFRRAYDVDGMATTEFDEFGATRKTLRQFLDADAQLDTLVRDILVPAP